MNLGIAFQIIDDILDYTENQETIGKPAGNDLRQGIVTLPLIYALQEQPKNGHYQEVHNLLNGATHSEEDIRTIVNWVVTGSGVQRSLSDANIYGMRAREALTHFSPSKDRQVLDELIDFVVMRKH
jgi:geranylgeranyl pyrophosphate synthase